MRVDKNVVLGMTAPKRTNTWGVIPHGWVIGSMDTAVREAGLMPEGDEFHEVYELSKDGHQFFSTWCFGKAAIIPMIGFRNSTNKTLTYGIAAGNCVINCSNLQFVGDFTDFKKHTGDLDYGEALGFAIRTVRKVLYKSMESINWLYKLQSVKLDEVNRKAYMYDQLKNKVISIKYLSAHKKCYEEEITSIGASKPFSLYTHHNATTRLLRQFSTTTIFNKTNTLYGISDDYYNRLAA